MMSFSLKHGRGQCINGGMRGSDKNTLFYHMEIHSERSERIA